jgi:hypothetical protein
MNNDMLSAYAEKELETATQLATQIATAAGGFKPNLRRLYGLPLDTRLIYAESGGLSNIQYFPEDTKVIIPIFPWYEDELQAKLGPLNDLRTLIDAGRILPIIQQPEYYCGYDHLKFLFERNTPSYFIRGSFALSAALGIAPTIEKDSDTGIVNLSAVTRLFTHCDKEHKEWLQYAVDHARCWEHRYRENVIKGVHDHRFYERLRSSLRYRYASVALCIGQYNADQIIKVFPLDKASSILLHLHILFDHLICHGVGSDFVVSPATPEGIDFQYSRRTGVARQHECVLNDLAVSLPEKDDGYVRGLLREEHFLREIEFSLVSPQSVRDIQDQLSRQFMHLKLSGMRRARN